MFIIDMLEEEDVEDRDYWIDQMTLQYFPGKQVATQVLLRLLQEAVGESEGIEIEWSTELGSTCTSCTRMTTDELTDCNSRHFQGELKSFHPENDRQRPGCGGYRSGYLHQSPGKDRYLSRRIIAENMDLQHCIQPCQEIC